MEYRSLISSFTISRKEDSTKKSNPAALAPRRRMAARSPMSLAFLCIASYSASAASSTSPLPSSACAPSFPCRMAVFPDPFAPNTMMAPLKPSHTLASSFSSDRSRMSSAVASSPKQ